MSTQRTWLMHPISQWTLHMLVMWIQVLVQVARAPEQLHSHRSRSQPQFCLLQSRLTKVGEMNMYVTQTSSSIFIRALRTTMHIFIINTTASYAPKCSHALSTALAFLPRTFSWLGRKPQMLRAWPYDRRQSLLALQGELGGRSWNGCFFKSQIGKLIRRHILSMSRI